MNHRHHHPGMTLGPLPIGMLANGSGTPVGIGIRLPIMTASLQPPPQMVHQPPQPHANQINNNNSQQHNMLVSMSPDSSEDIEKCLRMNSGPMSMSPPSSSSSIHHGTSSISQSNNNCNSMSNNLNNGLSPHWGTLLQQPMAGMLVNPGPMMGMNNCVGMMGPPNMNLGEPNMLYGLNLSSPSQGPGGMPRPHHLSLQPNMPMPPSPSQQMIEMSQHLIHNNNNNNHHNSITTISPSLSNNPQTNPVLHHHPPPPQILSTGIVNGTIPNQICSTTQQQQQQVQPPPPQQPNVPIQPVKEIIHCKSCTLFPPNPSAPPPTTREKPPGCRTVFVGGLPENGNEDLVREIFERCGEITTIRMSKKNFCHIRFDLESYIENAIYLSGFRIRIGSNSDAANIGRLHVDYAQARDDFYEWECRQRQLLREQRHRERLEQERLIPPSPPPVVHFSEHEAMNLVEKLKGDETFMKGIQVLMTWLERGDCSKKNANTFYSMIQSTNSHVRRLLSEKAQFEDELQKAKELAQQRMQGLIMQFCQIEKVFIASCHKKVWDHFTKAQRKNIDVWKKQATEIKNMQLEEALNERNEEEMDLSESDSEDNNGSPLGKRLRLDDDEQNKTLNQLKEENDALKCQLEAFKHEVELIKADLKTELELKEQQVRELQEQLANYRRSPIVISSSPTQSDIELQSKSSSYNHVSISPNTSLASSTSSTFVTTSTIFTTNPSNTNILSNQSNSNNISDRSNETENNLVEKCDSTQQNLVGFSGASTNEFNDSNNSCSDNNSNVKNPTSSCSQPRITTPYSPTNPPNAETEHESNGFDQAQSSRITDREARLVDIISTFLHVHPFGARARARRDRARLRTRSNFFSQVL